MNSSHRRFFATIAFLLMLPQGTAFATHSLGGVSELEPQVPSPALPVSEPDSPTVRRTVERIRSATDAVREALGDAGSLLGPGMEFGLHTMPRPVLRLYKDGAGITDEGPDARQGGYGDWYVIGDQVWVRQADGGIDRTRGLTTAVLDDGTYPANALGVLVSPELDLRTGFFDATKQAAFQPVSDHIKMPSTGVAAVDNTVTGACASGAAQATARDCSYWANFVRSARYSSIYDLLLREIRDSRSTVAPNGDPLPLKDRDGIGIGPIQGRGFAEQIAELRFQVRYNLGKGVDFVSYYVFTDAPPLALAQVTKCAPPNCFAVAPPTGYAGGSPRGVTGQQLEWRTETLDLTRFLGTRAWVVMVLRTSQFTPSLHFTNSGLVNTDVGFYGFQMDNLELVAPAATSNLQARPFELPRPRAQHAAAYVLPLQPVQVETYAVNTGMRAVTAGATIRIIAGDDTLAEWHENFDLGPGQRKPLRIQLPGLPEGTEATLELRLECRHLAQPCSPTGNDEIQSDDRVALPIVVRQLQELTASPLTVNSETAARGDQVTFQMQVANTGNVFLDRLILADLVDVSVHPPRRANELLQPENLTQVLALAPGESHEFQWVIPDAQPGQYRLFVRTNGVAPFQSDDLLPDLVQDLQSLRVAGATLNVDGALDEDVWGKIQPHHRMMEPFDYVGRSLPVGASAARLELRFFNDDRFLYGGVKVWDSTAGPRDQLSIFFDDLADHVAGTTDNLLTVSGSGVSDLHWDPVVRNWVADTVRDDLHRGARRVDAIPGRPSSVTFEFAVPLNTTRAQDLTAKPGDSLGIFLRYQDNESAGAMQGLAWLHYPAGADFADGGRRMVASFGDAGQLMEQRWGLRQPNGELSDEMAEWARLKLASANDFPRLADGHLRALSAGVGVDRSPPSHFFEALTACPVGWTQHRQAISNFSVTGNNFQEKWTCDHYQGSDGIILFEGLTPGVPQRCLSSCHIQHPCPTSPCPPYSWGRGLIRLVGQNTHWETGALVTPPFTVGDDPDPFLVIRHQYASEVHIRDVAGGMTSWNEVGGVGIDLNTIARVLVQTWDPLSQRWSDPIQLNPRDGYDTESTTGIADPARYPNGRPYIGAANYGADPCAGVRLEACGWWWPSGHQALYRAAGDIIPKGEVFSGSPWKTDIVPLAGTNHGRDGSTTFDPTGKTLRLQFELLRGRHAPEDSRAKPDRRDVGWRISGLAIASQPVLLRDLEVVAVKPAPAYDPALLGLGPSTTVPVAITVRNVGLVEIRNFEVDLTAWRQPDQNVACAVRRQPLTMLIVPGETREIRLDCHLGPGVGHRVRFGASIQVGGGDDFFGNNQLTDPTEYLVRPFHDLAVSVEVSPQVAPLGFARSVLVFLENRGNVPLDNITLVREIRQYGQAGLPDVLLSSEWKVHSPVSIGQKVSLGDASLSVTPTLVAHRDLQFDPRERGTYDVVVGGQVKDDLELENDFGRRQFQVRTVVYGADFDRPAEADPAAVRGHLGFGGTPDVWNVHRDGGARGNWLRAGDPETEELGDSVDAWIRLPQVDLAPLKQASLTFRHRYDLEDGYDAARAEVSMDGGLSWRPLRPVEQPLLDLAQGYPNRLLTGANPLLDGKTYDHAVGFTGSSTSVLDPEQGWRTVEFDLNREPELQRTGRLDTLEPDPTFAQLPRGEPIFGGPMGTQFRHPSWTLPEVGAEANSRYWWIENATFSEPQPRSGNRMWWSGSAGEATSTRTADRVHTALQHQIQFHENPAPGEALFLQFWDWRAGWKDSALDRAGTGGWFNVTLVARDSDADGLEDLFEERVLRTNPLASDTDGDGWSDGAEYFHAGDPLLLEIQPRDQNNNMIADTHEKECGCTWSFIPGGSQFDPDADGASAFVEQSHGTSSRTSDTDRDGATDGEEIGRGSSPRVAERLRVVEARADGWTLREVLVDHQAQRSFVLEARYLSILQAGLPEAIRNNNRGWFIDDLRLLIAPVNSYRGMGGAGRVLSMEDLESLDESLLNTRQSPWKVEVRPSNPPASPIAWRLVDVGGTSRDGGWQVQEVDVPGRGHVPVWRFSAQNDQGYPHGADARLVTPLVDLSKVTGSSATVTFQHKYGFEALPKSPMAGAADPAGAISGKFWSAIDGGTIEYQVLDEITGTPGPWRQLMKTPAPAQPLLFDAYAVGRMGLVDRLANIMVPNGLHNRVALASTGYSAIAERAWEFDWWEPNAVSYLPRLYPTGYGTSFELQEGLVTWTNLRVPPSSGGPYRGPWQSANYSYVFSGETPDWRLERWDISHLIGRQVRFAFHAVSNPGYNGAAPLHGWSVSGLYVEASSFVGRPIDLRLRVATDESQSQGEWSVDDISITGERYARMATFILDKGHVHASPGSTAAVSGRVANLGGGERNVAVGYLVFDHVTGRVHPSVSMLGPLGSQPEVPPAERPNGFLMSGMRGPFTVTAAGTGGSAIGFDLSIPLEPHEEITWTVRLFLFDYAERDGAPAYEPASNEVTGAGRAEAAVAAVRLERFDLFPPVAGVNELLHLDPAAPKVLDEVTARVGLRNTGTMPAQLTLRWTLAEVLQKSQGPHIQPGTLERIGQRQVHTSDQHALLPGDFLNDEASFQITRPGLYRLTAEFFAGERVVNGIQREFLVELPAQIYNVAFRGTSAEAAGWQDASPKQEAQGGGSVSHLVFRQVGGEFIWGLSDSDFAAGETYCRASNTRNEQPICNWPANADGTIETRYGPEGIAVGPVIDLSRVPGNKARLAFDHRFNFFAGDGARLEALPLVTPVTQGTPTPALFCTGGQPARYELLPLNPEPYLGLVRSSEGRQVTPPAPITPTYGYPELVHALNRGYAEKAVFGGPPRDRDVIEFDLARPAVATCSGVPATLPLLNYALQLVLHVGIGPGDSGAAGTGARLDGTNGQGLSTTVGGANVLRRTNLGAQGWQVSGLSLSSTYLDMEPRTARLPFDHGLRKTFSLTVENLGDVPDVVRFEIDSVASSLPRLEWAELAASEMVFMPRERRTNQVHILFPPDVPTEVSDYLVRVRATSASNPLIVRTSDLILALRHNPLPDLQGHIRLELESPTNKLEEGSVAPIHAVVSNSGLAESRAVKLQFLSQDLQDGLVRPLQEVELRGLCPAIRCGKDASRATATIEWLAPSIGRHRIFAIIDPDSRLQEQRVDNNVASLDVDVVPLARADIEVTDLVIEGVGLDGFVEEGKLLRILAVFTNRGALPAARVEAKILVGSFELTAAELRDLQPGESRTVEARKFATRGTMLVSAIALATGNHELRIDNNELRREIRVRGHDLRLVADPADVELEPGATSRILLTLQNFGNAVEHVLVLINTTDTRWSHTVTPNPVTVAPNGLAVAVLTLAAAPGSAPGQQSLALLARSVSTGRVHANTTLLASVPGLDAAVQMVLPETSVVAGRVAPLSLAVRGLRADAGSHTVNLIEPAWMEGPVQLQRGQDEWVAFPALQVPPSAIGEHRIVFALRDSAGRAVALLEKNLTIPPRVAADAQWTRIAPESAASGLRAWRIGLEINNTGNVPVRAILEAQNLTDDDVRLELPEEMRIAPGSVGSASVRVETTGAVEQLAWPFRVVLKDSLGNVTGSLPLPSPSLRAGSDVSLQKLDVRPSLLVRQGDPVHVVATVKNVGGMSSDIGMLSIFVDGALMEERRLPSLGPGVEYPLSFDWAAAVPGEHLLTVQVETIEADAETGNNGRSLVFSVSEADARPWAAAPAGAAWAVYAAVLIGAIIWGRGRRSR